MGAEVESADILRQIQAEVGSGHHYVLVLFVLEHIGGPDSPVDAGIAQTRGIFLNAELGFTAVDLRVTAPVPVTPLQTSEGGKAQSADPVVLQPCAAQTVVDAQAAFLVGAQYESASELLVEIAQSQFKSFETPLHVDVRHSPAVKVRPAST